MKVKNLNGNISKISTGIYCATHVAQVRKELVKCWELVIAKCHAGTTPLQVTEFRDSKEPNWLLSHLCCTSM